jgi:LacI family transcriptional regulator
MDLEKRGGAGITLAEVARAAGVSKMTASRALRGAPECSPATRLRVERAARELGYRPNPIVTLFQAAVRRRRVNYHATLGWLNDYAERGHHRRTLHLRRVLRGAEIRAGSRGFRIEEIWVDEADDMSIERRTARYEQIIQARGMPGVVLPILRRAELAVQAWAESSVVCLGGMVVPPLVRPTNSAFPELFHHVQPDFFANVELACVALRARGYRRIGLFMSEWHNRHTGRQYEAAFRLQLADWPGRDRVRPLITPEPSTEAEQRALLHDWVRKEKPDAVLCAIGHTCAWLREGGWRVPEDLGVAHLWMSDDTENWSGVDPDLEAVGAAAVDLLISQVQANARGQPPRPHRLSFLGRWVDGRTTR